MLQKFSIYMLAPAGQGAGCLVFSGLGEQKQDIFSHHPDMERPACSGVASCFGPATSSAFRAAAGSAPTSAETSLQAELASCHIMFLKFL